MKKPRLDYVVPEETREYYCFVMVTLVDIPAGMYGMDQKRTDLHAAMCAVYGLTAEETEMVTGNMDKLEHGAESLHAALCVLVEAKSTPPRQLHGLEKICKQFGRMKCGDTMMVWDYANECAIPEKEMEADKARWCASEKAKWMGK
jgi:hypothetical protein